MSGGVLMIELVIVILVSFGSALYILIGSGIFGDAVEGILGFFLKFAWGHLGLLLFIWLVWRMSPVLPDWANIWIVRVVGGLWLTGGVFYVFLGWIDRVHANHERKFSRRQYVATGLLSLVCGGMLIAHPEWIAEYLIQNHHRRQMSQDKQDALKAKATTARPK